MNVQTWLTRRMKTMVVLSLLAFFVIACSIIQPEPTPTPTPTTTPTPVPTTGSIQGTVYLVAEENLPFVGVEVVLLDPELGLDNPEAELDKTVTDENGTYSFPEVKPGEYTLTVIADLNEINPPPPEGCHFPPIGFAGDETWMIITLTADTGEEEPVARVYANLQEEFSISVGDEIQYDLDFDCK